MSRKDIYHDVVKEALIKEGWIITKEQLLLNAGKRKMYVDLSADLIIAEKAAQKIAVEIKSFLNPSEITDFQEALGQLCNKRNFNMDKHLKYQNIIQEFIQELAVFGQYPSDDIETQIIADTTQGHYLLYYNGWEDKGRTYGCLLHLELKENAKVYMHHNGTNLKIVDELMEKGIEKNDLVLAFQPPYVRAVSGFAVN